MLMHALIDIIHSIRLSMLRQTISQLASLIWLLAILSGTAAPGWGQTNLVFPTDMGVIDVTQAPYFATPNDTTDDTDAIQAALDDHPNGNRIIYLPNGTYRVSSGLIWGFSGSASTSFKRTMLQGQSQDSTIIQLVDSASGFGDPNHPQYVIRTAPIGFSADAFRNAVRNLTVNTGSGNPGAIAIQFFGSNQCRIERVTIQSEDGEGVIGLDLGYNRDNGPGLVRHLVVEGFDVGIRFEGVVNSFSMEHVTLMNQNVYGIENQQQVFNIRGLTSINSVPAIYNGPNSATLTLLEANLSGGTSGTPAIINASNNLYVRDMIVSGYDTTIRNEEAALAHVLADTVHEYSTRAIDTLFASPTTSLRLAIEETPEVPWDDLSDWVNIESYGANGSNPNDDTEAIQRAIDAGKTTVYIPSGGTYRIDGILYVRGNVRRIIGGEGRLTGAGVIIVEDGTYPEVIMERLYGSGSQIKLILRTSRTFILSSVSGPGPEIVCEGDGDLFLDDVSVSRLRLNHPDQRVWEIGRASCRERV